MLENIMTDDQKIDEIYRILKRNEARERRAFWWRLIFRLCILGIVVFGLLNFQLVVATVTRTMMPIVTRMMEQVMRENGNTILESSDAIKDSVIRSVKNAIQPTETTPTGY